MARTHTVLRILMVDRNRKAAEALADELSEIVPGRPEIVLVDGGRPAVETLRTGTFEIVALDLTSLLDLGGSAEDGIARIVKVADTALTLALTENESVSASLAAMRAGAHDVIQRPIDGAAFTSRVSALARRHGRGWTLTGEAEPMSGPGMAAMLNSAGAALRSAAEPPKRQDVLPMWRQEQRIIEDAIACFAGNITLAAQALELNPSTIYRKRQAWAEMENGAKGAA